MLSIRELDYEVDESPELVFSRLSWAVERVDGLSGALFVGATVDTRRPWVGMYDENRLNFGLIEPSGYFLSRKLFQIVARGQIMPNGQTSSINIKLRLGWNTLLGMIWLYASAFAMLATAINSANLAVFLFAGLWIVLFPVLGTFFLYRKLDKIERKVEELFGVV